MKPTIRKYVANWGHGKQVFLLPKGAHVLEVSAKPHAVGLELTLSVVIDADCIELVPRIFYLFTEEEVWPEEAHDLQQGAYLGSRYGLHIFDAERRWEPAKPELEAAILYLREALRGTKTK